MVLFGLEPFQDKGVGLSFCLECGGWSVSGVDGGLGWTLAQ